MSDTLQQAITLIQSGDRQNGKSLLADIIRDDPQNEQAWLLMTVVMDNFQQRQECLRRVLMINPYNQSAIEGLALLQEEQPQRSESFSSLDPEASLLTIISSFVTFLLCIKLASGIFYCNTCELEGLVIELPVFFVSVACSMGVGYLFEKWLRPPNPELTKNSRVEQKAHPMSDTLQQAITLIQVGNRKKDNKDKSFTLHQKENVKITSTIHDIISICNDIFCVLGSIMTSVILYSRMNVFAFFFSLPLIAYLFISFYLRCRFSSITSAIAIFTASVLSVSEALRMHQAFLRVPPASLNYAGLLWFGIPVAQLFIYLVVLVITWFIGCLAETILRDIINSIRYDSGLFNN
jgi:hypothetical protein